MTIEDRVRRVLTEAVAGEPPLSGPLWTMSSAGVAPVRCWPR